MNDTPAHAKSPSSPGEEVRQWRQAHSDLAEAMRRLVQFQKDAGELKKSGDLESALDGMERLLDHIVEYVFARLYLRGEDKQLVKTREFCPETIAVDSALIEWGSQNGEVALVPIELSESGFNLRSLVLLPFTGNTDNLGILLLWLPQDTSAFTQEQEAMLGILSRETSAVLETLRFRASLEKARGTLDDIVESVPHGLMAIDGDDFVMLINGTMEIAMNVRRAQVLGVPYMAALPPPVATLIRRMIEGRISGEQELTLSIGGAERHLGFTATPVRAERGHDGRAHVILCRDLEITREVAKLRELDAMKTDFLALVSHELRTPLTSIIAYTESLQSDPDVDAQTTRDYLGIIAGEGQKLCKIVDDVIDLTHMEAGKLDYHRSAVEPNEFIGTLLMHLESAFLAKKQEVKLEFGENLPDIRADSDRLGKAIKNILDNANKYTPEGGIVTVRTHAVEPDREIDAPSVQFDIEDNGPGIDPESQKRLFSKFGVIGNIAHHTSGTGLGMSIAKHIVEDGHAGRIWLESEPGCGTKVHIRVPAYLHGVTPPSDAVPIPPPAPPTLPPVPPAPTAPIVAPAAPAEPNATE